jgi:SAM-dependent methyltransferase
MVFGQMRKCYHCGSPEVGKNWTCGSCGNSPDISDGIPVLAPSTAHSNDGFSPDFFERLFDLEENHFWFQSRNKLISWAFENHFREAGNFFEIGCGNAFVLKHFESRFPDLVVGGCDIFLEGLMFARSRLNRASLIQMDIRTIPFEDEFDVIGMFDVLEHITDDESALTGVFKALKSGGGGVIITVPQHPALWSATDEVAFHKRRYTRSELRAKLMRAGFKIIQITSFVTLLLPLMLVSRYLKRSHTHDAGMMDELEIHSSLNYLLGKICAIELPIIKAGVSLPVGGSLLAVAKKAP